MSVEQTLAERQDRYGEFAYQASISQNLSAVMHAAPKWDDLSAAQKEALEMIQHKVARILNGDPNYGDNWHDIAGYATLVEKELTKGEEKLDWEIFGELAVPVEAHETTSAVPVEPPRPPVLVGNTWYCLHEGTWFANGTSVPAGEACPICFAIK